MSVEKTLDQREGRYGNFYGHAHLSQRLKDAMHGHPGWGDKLDYSMREALDMIAHKIARILNGDPYYADNWHDIAGYATLVERELKEADQDGSHNT